MWFVSVTCNAMFFHRLMTFMFLMLLFLFYHIYAYIELTPIDYFPTFAIKFLNWPVNDVSLLMSCLLYTSPSPRDRQKSRMPSSA